MSANSRSPSPQHRQQARQTRKDFDLEPNPFEQSFAPRPNSTSNLRTNDDDHHSSRSSDRSNNSPTLRSNSASPPRTILPPIASISSPADNYSSWTYPTSLRSGPLSPAMLAGPQPTQDQAPSQFDPSSFRTGLTPRSGLTPRTGLTPGTGLTPLVGGVAAYPTTPNTAAFMAMINNNTHPQANPTITPNTLNAITGVLNPSSTYQDSTTNTSNSSNNNNYLTSASNAATTAANGLFLLSQAHQELTKREEEAKRNNGVDNPPSPPSNGRRSAKRKSYDITTDTGYANGNGPTRTQPKRSRASTNRRQSISEDVDEDDEDDSGLDEPIEHSADNRSRRSANKKPETEEEKRRNFLERNRQAALKCRQRKKAWLASLQAKVEYLTNENERLTSALVSSHEEISRLSQLVGSAAVVGGPGAPGGGAGPVGAGGPPISMNVPLGGPPGKVGAVATGGRGGGYGY